MGKNSKKRKNLDNSLAKRKYSTDMEKCKRMTSGTHEENNIFPFSHSQMRELLAEFFETTENMYLNKNDHERGVVDILTGAARILRRIHQTNPRGSHALCYNPVFSKDIEFFDKVRSPYSPEDYDMYYTVDLGPNNKQLIHSVSKYLEGYLEGLVNSKVSDVSFMKIKNNPYDIEKTPYTGTEKICNKIDSPNSYNQENRSDFEMEDDTSTHADTLD